MAGDASATFGTMISNIYDLNKVAEIISGKVKYIPEIKGYSAKTKAFGFPKNGVLIEKYTLLEMYVPDKGLKLLWAKTHISGSGHIITVKYEGLKPSVGDYMDFMYGMFDDDKCLDSHHALTKTPVFWSAIPPGTSRVVFQARVKTTDGTYGPWVGPDELWVGE